MLIKINKKLITERKRRISSAKSVKIKINKKMMKEAMNALDNLSIASVDHESKNVYLFESNGITKTSFKSLLESVDLKERTLEEAILLWEKNAIYQLDEVLPFSSASKMDAAVTDVDSGVDPKGSAWSAVNSVSEAAIMLLIQGKDLILRAIRGGIKLFAKILKPVIGIVRKIVGVVGKFCSKHKFLCKVVLAISVMLVVFMAMSLFAAEAQAKVTWKGHLLDQSMVDMLKGAVHDMSTIGGDVGPGTGRMSMGMKEAIDAATWIDKANASTNMIDLQGSKEAGGEVMSRLFQKILNVREELKTSTDGSAGGFAEVLNNWTEQGKGLVGHYEEIIIKYKGGGGSSSMSASWGRAK
ncbi:MAG: hypothetical protein HN879_10285 [Flavobacteriaceae bacterium]|jgi:hypothetical protein|nr:hypothetical protein [Flavobacteriaceae bacterium]